MTLPTYPSWTAAPFAVLVFVIAVMPIVLPNAWANRRIQAIVVATCAAPIVVFLVRHGHVHELRTTSHAYLSFAATLLALFVTSGGVHVSGDLVATPRVNLLFILAGSLLASVIGTTGASMLLIRPLLRTNQQREHTGHIVPFFILTVANAGGLLTPLGDPPLLVGYLAGVPFLWTLRLLPAWLLYVASASIAFYFVDRAAYRREPASALEADAREATPMRVEGLGNLLLFAAIVAVTTLPAGFREIGLLVVAAISYRTTPRAIHRKNKFEIEPMADVAIVFAGLFATLPPLEATLAHAAPSLPLRHAWQLFWGSGMLSAVLDNAPTYAGFMSLGRGLGAGHEDLVAGVRPIQLAAISIGSVVMGATTYIGNGPNLMVKAIAERASFRVPSFGRYALFAFLMMLPAHIVSTVAFMLLER